MSRPLALPQRAAACADCPKRPGLRPERHSRQSAARRGPPWCPVLMKSADVLARAIFVLQFLPKLHSARQR
jgi:hypothetical protein